jgi:hypothetical protein
MRDLAFAILLVLELAYFVALYAAEPASPTVVVKKAPGGRG